MSEIKTQLETILANVYSLYLKTQNYHWNIRGPNFFSLHSMLEGQYQDLAESIDAIAERLRALKYFAPGGFNSYIKLRTLKDGNFNFSWQEMLKDLAADHLTICTQLQQIAQTADQTKDIATLDLMTRRLDQHQKTMWILKSFFDENL